MKRRDAITASALMGLGAMQSPLMAKAQDSIKNTHFVPKAKRVIFLFMQGGVSQMDSFDYKPQLNKLHGKSLPFPLPGKIRPDRLGKVYGTPWKWKQHGECGQWVSEVFPQTAKLVDKLCFLKGVHTDGEAHGQAVLRLHTGEANFVRPSMGSWVYYGLGSQNPNLPGFITIDYPNAQGGVRLYSNSFLPSKYQGMHVKVSGSTNKKPQVRHLEKALSAYRQQEQLDVIQQLNHAHLARLGTNEQIEGVINSFDMAYRMQSVAPEILDIDNESDYIKSLYGYDQKEGSGFARQCVLARRLSESGVRFVQVCSGNHWDHHGNIERDLPKSAAKTEQAIYGLITDLEARGLLDETLIVCSGEFGRTPVAQIDRGNPGRDHNPHGFTVWMCGAGVKQGFSYGATDELGYLAVEGRLHMHDLHATILHLLGMDHEKLSYRYAGRDFRLTDIYGHVAHDILA